MPKTQHYYVAAKDENGESLDLVVEATSRDEAKKLWLAWDTVASSYQPDEGDPEPKPDDIFVLPQLTGTSQILGWHEPGGLQTA